MTKIDYQNEILKFHDDHIRKCPDCTAGGACYSDLPKESEGYFEQGPEIAFVGERYGESDYPKILFTRLNPIKVKFKKPIFFFGSRESLEERRQSCNGVKELFRSYLDGWGKYRGLLKAGTVTGRPNARNNVENTTESRYGIQIIMNKMTQSGIFDGPNDSLLEFCAINNVIKCAGREKSSNPGGIMFDTCNFYKGELEILNPHIIIAFGNKAEDYLHSKFGNNISTDTCKYFKFPHPLNGGKYKWEGKDIEIPDSNKEPEPSFEPKMKQRKRLFNYISHVVKIAEDIKAALKKQRLQ